MQKNHLVPFILKFLQGACGSLTLTERAVNAARHALLGLAPFSAVLF